MAGPKARIEYVPLSEVKGAPRNPKDHDVGEMRLSVERHGLADPPALNEKTGRLVEGHGRLDVLRQMKVAGEPEPRYVQRRADGEWTIPVVRGLSWETDEEAEAYLVAHNRVGEKGGWDESVLTGVLSDLAAADALLGTGWDADEVDELIAQQEPEIVGHADPDEVPEPPDEPVTKRGDVWILGRHRVGCLDATSADDVDKLLSGAIPDMVYTDPPYGVDIVKAGWVGGGAAYRIPFGGVKNRGSVGASKPFGSKDKRGADGATNMVKAGIYDAVIGDDSAETAIDAYNLCAGLGISVLIFWGGNYYASSLPDSSGWIVWDKENTGNFADAELAWTNQKRAVRIFKHQWNGMLRASERGEKRVHPTQKPVALAEWCFENYGRENGKVLDLFAGSGSTLTACERTGRTCYVMELSERYVDVICRRFQEYTGTLPVLECTGETHDFTRGKAAA